MARRPAGGAWLRMWMVLLVMAVSMAVKAESGLAGEPGASPPNFAIIEAFDSGTLNTAVADGDTQEFYLNISASYIWNVVVTVNYELYNTNCMSNPGNSGSNTEVGLRLKDPATGTWVRLKSTDGGIGEVFNVTFDDDAGTSINDPFTPNCSTLSGTYIPRESLSSFDSHPGTGFWTLEVEDNICGGCSTGYGPTLVSWTLTLTHGTDIFAPTWDSGMGFSAQDAGTGGTVNLSWNAASDYNGPVTYNIYMSTTSGIFNYASPDATTNDTSYSFSGLTNHQPYYFVVRATDTLSNEDTNTSQQNATPTPAAGTGLELLLYNN